MTPKTTITSAEFERLAGSLGPAELIDGEIVGMSPGDYVHSLVTANICSLLCEFAKEHGLGRVLTNEVGIHVQQSPPRSRGVDIAFLSFGTLPRGQSFSGFLTFPPDLIVEVLGEGDTLGGLSDKIDDYHHFGVRMVWVADPRSRSLTLLPRGEPACTLGEDEALEGGAILPGFTLQVARLFDVE